MSRNPECPQAVNAAALAVGELDLAAQTAFQQHLKSCHSCRAELAALQKTVAQLRDARVTRFTRTLRFVRQHRLPAAAAALLLATGLGLWQSARTTPASTGRAADDGCAWISRQQEADGSWDPARNGGSALYRPALTALASLALMSEPDHFGREITAACTALSQAQQPDGALAPLNTGRMYNHTLATWALLTAYDKGRRPGLKGALDKAVGFIRDSQQASGGWGYSTAPDDPANTAVTAWQVQVLACAQQAGWNDEGGHLRKGLTWLRQRATNGQFDYTATHSAGTATPTLNAMGAYTLLTAGGAHPDLLLTATAAIRQLPAAPLPGSGAAADAYQAFFTAAAWDAAGDRKRANLVRAGVCSQRETRGAEKGSWSPTDSSGKVGGRLCATSLAVLTLQSRPQVQL